MSTLLLRLSSRVWSSAVRVLPVILLLGLISAGCDSSEPAPVPSATFSASVTGDTTASMDGSANLVDAGAAGSFTGAFIPLSFSDSSAIPVSGDPPEGTIITLQQNVEGDGYTWNGSFAPAIVLYLPGAGGPNAQSYQIQNPLLSGFSGGFGSPVELDPSALPVTAAYIDHGIPRVRTALGSRGTITIARVTDEGVFGEFSFTTDAAITIGDIPNPLTDTTAQTPDVGFEPFQVTVDGTFEAQRIDPSELDDSLFSPESFNP